MGERHRGADVVVLGGGLAGLSAGIELGRHAAVLERNADPGGVARSVCIGGFWFDHGAHVLYFRDAALRERIRTAMGDVLVSFPIDGRVQTAAGDARYPLQWNLAGIDPQTAVRCLCDLARACYAPRERTPENFEEFLLSSFGQGLCELFLFPYNRKLWQHPLESLAPGGFTWAIARPDFEAALRGALSLDPASRPYNAESWYPRPPADARQRGIGVVARRLARRAPGLHTRREVVEIDPARHTVTTRHEGATERWRWEHACASTLPLPQAIRLCRGVPDSLRRACDALPHNRVEVAAFGIVGPRPERGQFWYYADPSVAFTRVTYLHAFDPLCAPPEGWCLMAEVPRRAGEPPATPAALLAKVEADLRRCGALPDGCRVAVSRVLTVDPAYVVFTPGVQDVVDEACAFLRSRGITPLGRYGRWGYSSMCDAMDEGFRWGAAARATLGARPALALEAA